MDSNIKSTKIYFLQDAISDEVFYLTSSLEDFSATCACIDKFFVKHVAVVAGSFQVDNCKLWTYVDNLSMPI